MNQHVRVHSRPVIAQSSSDATTKRTGEVAGGLARTTKNAHLEDLILSLTLQAPVIASGTEIFESSYLNAEAEKHRQNFQTVEEKQFTDQIAFLHKSNTYSLLSPSEQESVYVALLAACHCDTQLRAENYTMPGYRNSKRKRKIGPALEYYEFRQTPSSQLSSGTRERKRKVVAVDCEMVGLFSGKECVAFLSAVDVLTGETLLNTYVDPMCRVKDWRSRFSGVTRSMMNEAIERRQALPGWRAARLALWEHIDESTILVGHALHNDLNVLGIFHSNIVDSAIMVSQAVFPDMQNKHFPQHWALKKLSSLFLGLTIQTGRKGHDCLEDTLATRELVLWCVKNPDRLAEWARQTHSEYDRKLMERKARNAQSSESEKKKASPEANPTIQV